MPSVPQSVASITPRSSAVYTSLPGRVTTPAPARRQISAPRPSGTRIFTPLKSARVRSARLAGTDSTPHQTGPTY